jgi:hypothetical protein
MGLESRTDESGLTRLQRRNATAAELRYALDEVSEFWTLLATSTGVLSLGPSTRGLPTSAAAADLSRLLIWGLSFQVVELHGGLFRFADLGGLKLLQSFDGHRRVV